MENNLHIDIINGIEISILDLPGSKTANHVFNELSNNQYGLENIEITEDDTVIDIGANTGIFSIYVKKKFNCKIICFEPVPEIFELLKTNLILNGISLTDLELHNVAITDRENGSLVIGTPADNSGGSSEFYLPTWKISECKTDTLPKYLKTYCKYLKIDCEGSEYRIIPTILDKLQNIENIGIEYHKVDNFEHDPINLHGLLKKSIVGNVYSNINHHT
jgi:FkbM family methyltransferase